MRGVQPSNSEEETIKKEWRNGDTKGLEAALTTLRERDEEEGGQDRTCSEHVESYILIMVCHHRH